MARSFLPTKLSVLYLTRISSPSTPSFLLRGVGRWFCYSPPRYLLQAACSLQGWWTCGFTVFGTPSFLVTAIGALVTPGSFPVLAFPFLCGEFFKGSWRLNPATALLAWGQLLNSILRGQGIYAEACAHPSSLACHSRLPPSLHIEDDSYLDFWHCVSSETGFQKVLLYCNKEIKFRPDKLLS